MGRFRPARLRHWFLAIIALLASCLTGMPAQARDLPVDVHVFLDRTGYFGAMQSGLGPMGVRSLDIIADLKSRLGPADRIQIHLIGGTRQQRQAQADLQSSRLFSLGSAADREGLDQFIDNKRTAPPDFTYTDIASVFQQIGAGLAAPRPTPRSNERLKLFIVFSDFVNLPRDVYSPDVAKALSLAQALDQMRGSRPSDVLKDAFERKDRRMNGLVIAYQTERPPNTPALYNNPATAELFHQEIRRAVELASGLRQELSALPLALDSSTDAAGQIISYLDALRPLESTLQITGAKITTEDATGKFLITLTASNRQGAPVRVTHLHFSSNLSANTEGVALPQPVVVTDDRDAMEIGPHEIPPEVVARLWDATKIEVSLGDLNNNRFGRRQVDLPAIPPLRLDSLELQITGRRDGASAQTVYEVEVKARNPFAGARRIPELRVHRQRGSTALSVARAKDGTSILETNPDRDRVLTYLIDPASVNIAAAAGDSELQGELRDQPASAAAGRPQTVKLLLPSGGTPPPIPPSAACKVAGDTLECPIEIANPTEFALRATRAVLFLDQGSSEDPFGRSTDVAAADGQVEAGNTKTIVFRFNISVAIATRLVEVPRVYLEVRNAEDAPLLKRPNVGEQRVGVTITDIPDLNLNVEPFTVDTRTAATDNRVRLLISRNQNSGVFMRVPIRIKQFALRKDGGSGEPVRLTHRAIELRPQPAEADKDAIIELAANTASIQIDFDPSILRDARPGAELYAVALIAPWKDPKNPQGLLYHTVPRTPRMLVFERSVAYYMPFSNPAQAQISVRIGRPVRAQPDSLQLTLRDQNTRVIRTTDDKTNLLEENHSFLVASSDTTRAFIVSADSTDGGENKETFKNAILSSEVMVVATYVAAEGSRPFELRLRSKVREPTVLSVGTYDLAIHIGRILLGLIATSIAVFLRSRLWWRLFFGKEQASAVMRAADSAFSALGISTWDVISFVLSIGLIVFSVWIVPERSNINLMATSWIPPVLAALGTISLVYVVRRRRYRRLFRLLAENSRARGDDLRRSFASRESQDRSIEQQAWHRALREALVITAAALAILTMLWTIVVGFADGDPFWRPWLALPSLLR